MADDFSELKSLAQIAVEYLDLLVDTTKELGKAQEESAAGLKKLGDQVELNTKAHKGNTDAKNKNTDETKKASAAFSDLTTKISNFGSELVNIGNAGLKFGTLVGTTAVQGVQLEINSRKASVSQLSKLNANLAVTAEQIKAAKAGFADAFIGVAEGSQLSTKGSLDFIQSLRTGFKSRFEPTAETFRVLTQMGMTTTQQFDAFRRSTGRAGLSNEQLIRLYRQNAVSFLLYGNSFSKAAVRAEQLGISLSSIQAAQESLVTNLDGTIDTVAQLNQLGAGIDFGTLVRIAEQDGPDALLGYVRRVVPEQMMQSASTRSLFKQLGISVEDYLKAGGKQNSAAEIMEQKMTEAASEVGKTAQSLAKLVSAVDIIQGSFYKLITALFGAVVALKAFSLSAVAPGRAMLTMPGGAAASWGSIGALTRLGAVTGGVGMGMGAGEIMGASRTSSIVGSLIGTVLGSFFGPMGAVIGGSLGGAAAGLLAPTQAEDLYSGGYGRRVLMTANGAYALNNADDIVAGTNLFPKGAISMGGDSSDLNRKIDELIRVLTNANTVINIDGASRMVPRAGFSAIQINTVRNA